MFEARTPREERKGRQYTLLPAEQSTSEVTERQFSECGCLSPDGGCLGFRNSDGVCLGLSPPYMAGIDNLVISGRVSSTSGFFSAHSPFHCRWSPRQEHPCLLMCYERTSGALFSKASRLWLSHCPSPIESWASVSE